MRPIRLTVVLTHPIQYYGPWFRQIAADCPELDLTVLYGIKPTGEQQGVGFGRAFEWDADLLSGYRSRFVRDARAADRLGTEDWFGLDVRDIGTAIEGTHPDVVLIPGWHSITLVRALRACRRLGVRVLYRGDTHLQSAPRGWRGALWALRTRHLLRQFSGYLSVGTRSEAFLRYFSVSDDRIVHAPHAVDNAFFASAAAPWQTSSGRESVRQRYGLGVDDFVVLFAGKLEEKKRPLDVIRATARLARPATVLMAGSGALEDVCRAEAASLGVQAQWTGFLNQSEMPAAYAAADCLVLPSDARETWGLVVNEAMATGLPCIVSDAVGCAPDLIQPDQTGERYACGDVEGLAAQIDRVRDLRAAGQDFAEPCRTRVSHFSLADASAGLVGACQAVLDRSSSRADRARVLAVCTGMVVPYGLERMAFEALRAARQQAAAVHCVVNDWENARIVAMAEAIGASWSEAPARRAIRRDLVIREPLQTVGAIARASAALLRAARVFRPSCLFVSDYPCVLRHWPALLVCRAMGVPVIFSVQNAPASTRFHRRLWRWAIGPAASRLVACSRFVQEQLLACGIPGRKIELVYNVAPVRARPATAAGPHEPATVIYVGQIVPQKGVDLLLEAVAMVTQSGIDAHLDIVGPMDGWIAPEYGDYRERLRRRAAQPDLAGRVRFLGRREDVPALLHAAAVHCCPSRPEADEGFPLVVLEAKRAGIPSVVSGVGPLPEQVRHRVDGWVCTELTASAIAEGLRHFLGDERRAREAGREAARSATHFSHARFADAWSALLSERRRKIAPVLKVRRQVHQ